MKRRRASLLLRAMQEKNSRREFIKKAALAGAGIMIAPSLAGTEARLRESRKTLQRSRPFGAETVHDLTTEPRERVRVGIIGLGQRGLSGALENVLKIPFADVVALCDSVSEQAEKAKKYCEEQRPEAASPEIYAGTQSAWESLCERDDIDVVYICTPWNSHVSMALKAMNCGKHAFVEVASAVSVENCWDLVDTSELTRRHCVLLENCCYGENELFVLNMIREGVFGTLTHAECAYIHDLRALLFQEESEGKWRRHYHRKMNGNLYSTHGLGPVCRYLDINRGDALAHLVSMSSPEANLSAYRNRENPSEGKYANEKYICGDMNTTLIKTKLGRSILLQHDVVSPRPYSRLNALTGTGGTFLDYPPRLALEYSEKYGLDAPEKSRAWLGASDMRKMRERFSHPLWRDEKSEKGGMDFVMNYRLLDCIRRGITPEITVYDLATWCAITDLSVRSVSAGSAPIEIPDFTRGSWKTARPI